MESDYALIDQFIAGEERAFERLVVRHQKVIYFMVLRIVGNRDDAADISQQVFLRAFREIRGFKRKASLRTWLCQIAINLRRNHLRRSRRTEWIPVTGQEENAGDIPSEVVQKRERDRKGRRSIRELPERQRLTLILRIYHQMSHREIGETLGISENNSRANYFHALRNLKTILIERGEVDDL